ncbi:flagellar basal body rod protein FlgB [Brevibacillus fluminis]|uniref:Flagellar basal body rod protein FlgB n=1 Tax=Brevibacillus fluminis TaxID=511487 RepID=A0A3M8DUL5_9BACL|nr:flagellar basal body rod protein FlgB [Brevibacillus fluminis]RNB91883.1 flagellar basal body rod protein FlgB [Brevibacillus fluminis]
MLFNQTLGIMERSLDASSLRLRTIQNNIANVDTPQYKSKQVAFESMLQAELNGDSENLPAYRTDARHIPFSDTGSIPLPTITSNSGLIMQNNGNNVDVEYEETQLAKTQLYYRGLADMTNGYFVKMKSVIDGGR